MKKFKLCGVSLCALLSATGANAAGYTCEELIEYTSCMPGYYLLGTCPEGSKYFISACDGSGGLYEASAEECAAAAEGSYYGRGCFALSPDGFVEGNNENPTSVSCSECPAGSSCAGAEQGPVLCSVGTYQPSTGQTSCLTTPAGNYSGYGATSYTACAAGKYQPRSGQSSCVSCPAGSYCETTGLSAVSGICPDGAYSGSGATACSSCPATGLTDANGDVVVAVTGKTGATGMIECYVGSDVSFKNDKGTYHYKSACNAYGSFDAANATTEERAARCTLVGGEFDADFEGAGIEICYNNDFYYQSSSLSEEECAALDGRWTDEDGYTYCYCYAWEYNLNTGKTYCRYN